MTADGPGGPGGPGTPGGVMASAGTRPAAGTVGDLRRRRPPARIVHVGLGAFARAHVLWYTQHAADGAEWGVTGFTGRSPRQAEVLAAQDCVYTLIERGDEDRAETIDALVAAHDGGADEAPDAPDAARAWASGRRSDAGTTALAAAVADPATALVTLTITENGYAPGSAVLGRLADALEARRRADAGPVALVPCDNLPGNAGVLRDRLLERASSELADWIGASVSFVSTVVDRITPATTDIDIRTAERLVGAADAAPVVTEPYSAWTLAGAFPAGRPAWETRGAEFVDDVEPAEHRKLWLLNGSHSLLAYRGLALGHTTVAEAMDDPRCADLVAALWREAGAALPYDDGAVAGYTDALRARYANARIEHRLAQIARDGSAKLGPRILDPLRARLAAGLGPGAAECATIAAWIAHVAAGRAADDAGAQRLDPARPREAARVALATLAPDLADTDAVVAMIAESIRPMAE